MSNEDEVDNLLDRPSRLSLSLANAIILDEKVGLVETTTENNVIPLSNTDKQNETLELKHPNEEESHENDIFDNDLTKIITVSSNDSILSPHTNWSTPSTMKRADSMMVFEHNVFDDLPKGYCSFDGNIVFYNDLFADIIGIANVTNTHLSKTPDKLSILSISKFLSFEGPQTTAFLFNSLHNDYINKKILPKKEFSWTNPLGMMRKGLLEKKLDITVTFEEMFYDTVKKEVKKMNKSVELLSNQIPVLSILIKIPNKPTNMPRNTRAISTIGSFNTEEVMKLSNKKIYSLLVIDNSTTTLKLISQMILDAGHRVTTESDSANALEVLKTMSYDVVLVDIDLLSPLALLQRLSRTGSLTRDTDLSTSPTNEITRVSNPMRQSQANLLANSQANALKNNSIPPLKQQKSSVDSSNYGLTLIHEFRIFERLNRSVNQSKIVIIAMSSEFNSSTVTEAMNAGYDGFIAKPFDVADLLSIVMMCNAKKSPY